MIRAAMSLEILHPHGMCSGVRSAIAKAKAARNAYCLGHLVHSELVTREIEALGTVFASDIEDIPDSATVIFPAHGVPPAVRRRAAEKGLSIIDGTCPFVERAHRAAREFSAAGIPVVVLGDPAHTEVRGILGEIDAKRLPKPGDMIGVVCQTTLAADIAAAEVAKLREKYDIAGVSDICTASKERQDAVRRFDGDALLVLGSRSSANTKRLLDVARCPAFLASDMDDVAQVATVLAKYSRIGITSGASTPEAFFESAVEYLRQIAARPHTP